MGDYTIHGSKTLLHVLAYRSPALSVYIPRVDRPHEPALAIANKRATRRWHPSFISSFFHLQNSFVQKQDKE